MSPSLGLDIDPLRYDERNDELAEPWITMVKGFQVICTPWRDDVELLRVKRCLFPAKYARTDYVYGAGETDAATDARSVTAMRRRACDQISAWKLRPPLPHAVESTWLLTEALLADGPSDGSSTPQISVFSVKAGYVTALIRFVTALLDSTQTSKYKVSMYTKAAEMKLPSMFVDIRHEATHGEMPSLPVLRDATERALEWLWRDFWDKLEGREAMYSDDEEISSFSRGHFTISTDGTVAEVIGEDI